MSLAKIKNDLNLDMIKETIRRILKKSALVMYEKIPRKQPLNHANKMKLLQFSRVHEYWNEE